MMTTIVYPVADLDAAKAVYGRLLDAEPETDTPYYVGYRVDGQDIALDPNGHKKGMTGPVTYFNVADIKAALAALTEAGAQIVDDAKDVGGGKLIATLKDADGNVTGLIQPA